MKQYWAIVKRDWGANGGQTFWLPGPVFAVLFAWLMTWWFSFLNDTTERIFWYFLGMTVFCAYRILQDVQLSHGHNLAFLLPNFKHYQYNYSSFLLLGSCLVTCFVSSDTVLEFFVFSSILWFVLSFMFFFVEIRFWKITYILLIIIYFSSSLISIRIGKIVEFNAIFASIYEFLWSRLSDLSTGILVSVVCIGLSIRNFLIAKQKYLEPKEYDMNLQPMSWKRQPKSQTVNKWQLFMKPIVNAPLWDKIERKMLFGIEIGRVDNILYQGLFGTKAYSGVLMIAIACIFSTLIPFLTFAMAGFYSKAALLPASVLMLSYLITVGSVISLEWISNRQAMATLWLLDNSDTRSSYMLKLALLFAERAGRVGIMCCGWFFVLSFIALGRDDFFIVASVTVGTILLGFLMQIAFVLFVTAKVENTTWLRYVTFVFTTVNFTGLSAVIYFSIQYNAYESIGLAALAVSILCYRSIKHWCTFDKELHSSL